MLRATRPLFYAAQNLKASTGITGLAVHPKPLPALKSLYAETLTALSALPQSSVYRQGAESFTKSRLEIVDKAQAAGNDIAAAEAALGGMVEVAIEEAQAELKLVGKMGEWKAWEPLVEKPVEDQWRYFDPTGDSL